jgi:hypothetical protein
MVSIVEEIRGVCKKDRRREERFFLDSFFVRGTKNLERHGPLRRARIFTPARLKTWMKNVPHVLF